MISIYTLTLGREYYLKELILSIISNIDTQYEHVIGFQGVTPSEDLQQFIKENKYNAKLVYFPKNIGGGEGSNKLIPMLSGTIIMKLDEDAKIVSRNYGTHVIEIHRMNPDCIFSPYPVGLIRNPGGVPKNGQHRVQFSDITNTYYTLRPVPHIGGFARISPREIITQFHFPYDLSDVTSGEEDTNFSSWARDKGCKMYYLENSIVVEHQESTLGQHERYKEYFNRRF